ncbi:MAG: C40 family peptidase [Flavobacteriales bacterium]|jgi:cell wall-associated NlpC family hydrolase|tara:strand:+ start:759 stop:1340 length:582 start_codon:yes stop_codon:yes gene_type:complete
MNKIKRNLSKYLKSLIPLLVAIITCLFLFNENDVLLEKLNENVTLIEKYNKFKSAGINKTIEFPENIIEKIIDTAMSFVGTPNKIGGIDKSGIDASGLVYVSIKKNSNTLFPRIAQDMARYGLFISDSDNLKRGDLVFFHDTYEVNRIITSVGIYLGDGEFINSSSSKGVTVSDINDPYYWKEKFFFGTRILN